MPTTPEEMIAAARAVVPSLSKWCPTQRRTSFCIDVAMRALPWQGRPYSNWVTPTSHLWWMGLRRGVTPTFRLKVTLYHLPNRFKDSDIIIVATKPFR